MKDAAEPVTIPIQDSYHYLNLAFSLNATFFYDEVKNKIIFKMSGDVFLGATPRRALGLEILGV